MNSFSERQRFTQWWLWTLIIAALVVPIVLTMYKARVNHIVITPADMIVGSIVPVLVIVLFLTIQLRSRIDEAGIHYKFVPWHFQEVHIGWDEIDKAYIRTYSPLKEYGGWGIRKGFGKIGRAFNISGNVGLQIELKDGKRILIGTRQTNEIKQTLLELVRLKVITHKTMNT